MTRAGELWKRLAGRLGTAHAPTESALPLAVFRVLFCGLLLREIWFFFDFRELLFDAEPHRWPSRIPVGPALFFWAASVLLLLVGYRTRAAAAVNYAFSVVIIGFSADRYTFQGHWDCFILYAAVLFLLSPVDEELSVDAALRRRAARQSGLPPPPGRIGSIHYAVVALGIGAMYLDSCAYKLASPMYRSGLGLWAPASLPYNLHHVAVGLLDNELLSRASGYFAIGFELSFCVLIWVRRLRPYLVAAGVIFHLAILYFFPLWSFSSMVAVFYLALLPASFYERMAAWVRSLPRAPDPAGARASLGSSPWPSAPRQPSSSRLARAALNGWVALSVLSFVVLALGGPLGKLAGSEASVSRLQLASSRYRQAIYPWTGFAHHGVFLDAHFRDYSIQLRLVYRGAQGSIELPLVSDEGTCLEWNFDRLWTMWNFRTVRPSLPLERAEENLRRFALHWSHEEKVDLRKGHLEILARPVAVALHEWEPGLLRRNLGVPWAVVGEIRERPKGMLVSWKHRPRHAATLAQVARPRPELHVPSTSSELMPEPLPPVFAPARLE